MHEYVYKCAMAIRKLYYPMVLLIKLYILMDMYIKYL